MRRPIFAFALSTFALCACAGPPPREPEPAGITSKAVIGDAEIEVRYRFAAKIDRELVLYVDVITKRPGDGHLSLSVEPHGFDVASGESRWQDALDAPRTSTHDLTLRATATTPTITIVTRHAERGVELAKDELHFIDGDEGLRECQPTDEGC